MKNSTPHINMLINTSKAVLKKSKCFFADALKNTTSFSFGVVMTVAVVTGVGVVFAYTDGGSASLVEISTVTAGSPITANGTNQIINAVNQIAYDIQQGNIGGIGKFVGLTSGTFDGSQGGYNGANNKCNTSHVGSHVCSTAEILYAISSSNSAFFSLSNDVEFWINTGPSKYTTGNSVNDCQGWTSANGSNVGNFWKKTANGGKGLATTCNVPNNFACCK